MQVQEAKSLCGGCPVRAQCLEGALSRQEPAGVWGGELFEEGRIIAKKRKAGRPSSKEIAARNAEGELIELKVVGDEREENAA
jgi:WhiB family redox-sensing transcriptional regulator